MMIEKDAWNLNGYIGIVILFVLMLVATLSVFESEYWLAAICIIIGIVLATGMTFVQPNQAMVIQFLGKYGGTYRNAGIVMLLPFSIKQRISLRVKAYQSEKVTIYEMENQGYDFSLMLVYKIVDVAKAVYDIEDIEKFIDLQCEIVIRKNINHTNVRELMENSELLQEISVILQDQLEQRLQIAGIELLEIQLFSIPKSKVNNDQLLPAIKALTSMLEKNDIPLK